MNGQQPVIKQASGRKPKHSEERWNEVKPVIRQLYMDKNESLPSVMETMRQIHDFDASVSMYKSHFGIWRWVKNDSKDPQKIIGLNAKDSVSPRKRKTQAKPPKSKKVKGTKPSHSSIARPMKSSIEETLSMQILSSINQYIDSAFDARSKSSWKFDDLTFRPPSSLGDDISYWQLLADRSYAASTSVVRFRTKAEFDAKISDFFTQLSQYPENTALNPYALSLFWHICHTLRGMCYRRRGGNLPRRFLRDLKPHMSKRCGASHAFVLIIDALNKLTPHAFTKKSLKRFKHFLSLGYERTLTQVGELIGNGHPLVLEMWSRYLRYWDSPKSKSEKQSFLDNHRNAFNTLESKGEHQSVSSVTALYRYTYAAFYVCVEYEMAYDLAAKLWKRTLDSFYAESEPIWDMMTRGHVLGVAILAEKYSGDFEKGHAPSFRYWDLLHRTINHLQSGDPQCQLRAVLLSERLERRPKGDAIARPPPT